MQDDAHYDSPSLEVLPGQQEQPQPLAPWWHTAAVLVLFLLWTIAGSERAHEFVQGSHVVRYLGSAMAGWMTLGCVVAGVYHRRDFFRVTLERNARPWYLDAAIGFGIYIIVLTTLAVVQLALHHTRFAINVDRSIIIAMSPRNVAELGVWFFVSATAGFCEEHVFRGYLLRQSIAGLVSARISSTVATITSIIATSVLFGALHLYQGVGGAILISLLGIIYSVFALRLNNLRALIVAHFLQDFLTGTALFVHYLHSK